MKFSPRDRGRPSLVCRCEIRCALALPEALVCLPGPPILPSFFLLSHQAYILDFFSLGKSTNSQVYTSCFARMQHAVDFDSSSPHGHIFPTYGFTFEG